MPSPKYTAEPTGVVIALLCALSSELGSKLASARYQLTLLEPY
jgi:hypothetical protein